MNEENKTYEQNLKIINTFLGEVFSILTLQLRIKLRRQLQDYCDAVNIQIDIEKTVDDFLINRGEK